ncbi:hypothetical protein P167DRAFT_540596 [Morchella conica CCBAS932]|uniref:Uncharacterized protein n=1 Tax=Morchella conica CCBAS932 TaxID=1392247 RepID=A0A3N4KBB3_9PEZI|nr:hypothetical protein P167DRAFT_540596 [Morchella conica CCBAS932]
MLPRATTFLIYFLIHFRTHLLRWSTQSGYITCDWGCIIDAFSGLGSMLLLTVFTDAFSVMAERGEFYNLKGFRKEGLPKSHMPKRPAILLVQV